jgi:predicted nucleic acid-binding protein
MEQKYLIDTNIIIDLSENKLPTAAKIFVSQIIDKNPYISIINKIELLSFSVTSSVLIEFTEYANILELSDNVVSKTIAIRRKHKIKTPDAIIAATSLVNNLTLITRNTTDFKNIKGIKLLNPWNL